MKNHPLRDFFHFSKSDRHAVIAIGGAVILGIGIMLMRDVWTDSTTSPKISQVTVDTLPVSSPIIVTTPTNATFQTLFDPNTVDSLTLSKFGIASWKIARFLHYRAAGKVFRSAQDLSSTYGWTDEDVKRLTPYVRISSAYTAKARSSSSSYKSKNNTHPQYKPYKFQTLVSIDANQADSATLCRIPGIGAGIARAILRYRTRLGGFHSTQQLLEVPHFSPELLDWFTLSEQPNLIQIPINTASFQTLRAHPYITIDQTRRLLHYIQLYGNIEDEQTLLSTYIFTAEEIAKLRPYIIYSVKAAD